MKLSELTFKAPGKTKGFWEWKEKLLLFRRVLISSSRPICLSNEICPFEISVHSSSNTFLSFIKRLFCYNLAVACTHKINTKF